MNIARVAFHASKDEAAAWIDRQGAAERPAPKGQDLREAWRASLESLGVRVEE